MNHLSTETAIHRPDGAIIGLERQVLDIQAQWDREAKAAPEGEDLPDDVQERFCEQLVGLEKAIADVPATTLSGVLAKLRRIQQYGRDFKTISSPAKDQLVSAIADLERMTGDDDGADPFIAAHAAWQAKLSSALALPDDFELTNPAEYASAWQAVREAIIAMCHTPVLTCDGAALALDWLRADLEDNDPEDFVLALVGQVQRFLGHTGGRAAQ